MNFNCSIGWGSQSSSLSVNLVEDTTLEEEFSPVNTGLPAYFVYDNFTFGGIVQNYKKKNSPQGYPVYEVTLVDPRDILEGVQIIIDGYTGTIGSMPNLFNVYGYLENISFGYSESNETGILTSKLRTGINALLGQGILTNPINYLGEHYYVDLSSLPSLPAFHRIGGGVSLSLMEIISRICEDGACDYFVRLVNAGGVNVIKVHTISRLNQPPLGMINAFIQANTVGAVSNEVGLESRNEVVGKFLVGGQVCAMYFQFPDDGEEGFDDDTILQFWGLAEDGDIIIEEAYEDDNPKFTLDSRKCNVIGVGARYDTDVEEMRCAIAGQTSWEMFLNAKDGVVGSPHQGKATALGLPAQNNLAAILGPIQGGGFGGNVALGINFAKTLDLQKLSAFTGRNVGRFDKGDKHQENVARLFKFVSDYANEYYGKKYMVRIDSIMAHRESETDRIITNVEPTEGGFIDEADYPQAIGNKWMPNDFIRLSTDDGRLQAYVRFDDADELDLSEISPNDYVLEANTVYIKCTVDPIIYVLDLVTLDSPRVIITLPGRIYGEDKRNDFAGVLKDILGPAFVVGGINGGLNGADMKRVFKELLTHWGADKLMLGKAGVALLPDMAAIPLKSNVLTYGPWQAHGANGKVDFEQNNELVPWIYGGFTALNQVGNALVSEALAGQVRGETGSITIPGAPEFNLGDELIAGGPFITSVSVDIGTGGVTSTYRMETWTPRFGKMAKLNAERMSKLYRENATRRRELRKLNANNGPNAAFFQERAGLKINTLGEVVPRNKNSSSQAYIGGQILKEYGEENRFNEVAILPEYNAYAPLSNNYGEKAFMSLDGLFRPFSTKKDDEDVPHYEEPEDDAEKTVDDLDPFKEGTDVRLIACDTELQDNEHIRDMTSPDKRPMALRGPLVVCGWGYDTNGKPVPNEHDGSDTDPSDEFYDNYLERSDKWKVGPVDLRWDGSRKVWAAGLGANIRVIKMAEDLEFGAVASGTLMDLTWGGNYNSSPALAESSSVVAVCEILGYSYYDSIAVIEGKYVLAIQSNEESSLYLMISAFLE